LKKYSLFTLGCKVNQVDSAAMGNSLNNAGYKATPFGKKTDLVIINTCAVTGKSDREGRKIVARARRISPNGFIVVTGCSPGKSQSPEAYPDADLVCGNVEKGHILSLIKTTIVKDHALPSVSISGSLDAGPILEPAGMPKRTRAFLKVQDGCDHNCAYCIVPLTRGASRSVSLDDAVSGFLSLAEKGFREIVLVGIHLGDWGLDLPAPLKLADLVDKITSLNDSCRVRLSSIEPPEIDKKIISLVAGRKTLCRHLHIPVQSADDNILKSMNREYDADYLWDIFNGIHGSIPGVTLGTDIIVGFPGETENDFQKTYSFVKGAPLSHLHIFPFSKRPGTACEKMERVVEPAVIKKRAAALRALGMEKKIDHYKKFIGKTLQVICEGKKKNGLHGGMSDNYIPVFFDGHIEAGRLVEVKIEKETVNEQTAALVGKL